MKCWKSVHTPPIPEENALHIGDAVYVQMDATEEEIAEGSLCLSKWHVERLYEVQVCGPDSPRGHLERRTVTESVPFEALIFSDGKCIGIYYDECTMLFDDVDTHVQKKWLGEFITGPDRTYDAYDYYYLIKH